MLEKVEIADQQPAAAQSEELPVRRPVPVSRASSGEDESLIGNLLNERYRIECVLSQGGMGIVYEAHHVVLHTKVAIKVLRHRHESGQQRRFIREARLACTVRHPNTIQIMDCGVLSNGRAYLAMEMLRGRTLDSELEKGRLAILRVCHIGAQIARGLQAIHDRGIVHCDVKPANVILLKQDGTSDFVKILDFGIAQPIDQEARELRMERPESIEHIGLADGESAQPEQSQMGPLAGTPLYMSPEQCQGCEIDERSDQYSFGCMLYEMLTGEPPFLCSTTDELMMEHVSAPVEPLHERAPQLRISASLESVVLRMLAKDPELRFSSLREVEESLLREADSIRMRSGEWPPLPGNRGQPQASSWRIGAGILGLFAIAAGILSLTELQPYLKQRQSPRMLMPVERLGTNREGRPPSDCYIPRADSETSQHPSHPAHQFAESSSEAAVRAARRALHERDLPLALREFERSISLCMDAYPIQPRQSCSALEYKLAFERGQIFEQQKHWGEAMLEYQKAASGAGKKERALASASMLRLTPHLGKVVIRSDRNGKCLPETQWLEPGSRQLVKVGSTRQEIQVYAGQTIDVGNCR